MDFSKEKVLSKWNTFRKKTIDRIDFEAILDFNFLNSETAEEEEDIGEISAPVSTNFVRK
jgi:hypothetical protein